MSDYGPLTVGVTLTTLARPSGGTPPPPVDPDPIPAGTMLYTPDLDQMIYEGGDQMQFND